MGTHYHVNRGRLRHLPPLAAPPRMVRHHLVAIALVSALAISLSRERRTHRGIRGIQEEAMAPDITSTAAVAAMVVILSALGIYTVLFLSVS